MEGGWLRLEMPNSVFLRIDLYIVGAGLLEFRIQVDSTVRDRNL